jgi:hypothetical protein
MPLAQCLSRTAYEERIWFNTPMTRINIPINSTNIGIGLHTDEEGMESNAHEEDMSLIY